MQCSFCPGHVHIAVSGEKKLVTNGPYAWIRHSACASRLLGCAGIPLMMNACRTLLMMLVLDAVIVGLRVFLEERDRRELSISVDQGNGRAQVVIADTGMGIAEENQEKIFLPFFTMRPSGTGLGLAISRKIVEDHGGDMQVSSGLGEGTRMSIFLPPLD